LNSKPRGQFFKRGWAPTLRPFKKTGTDVMIFKIFSPKKNCKKLAFLTQDKAKVCKILIIPLVFEKKSHFFAENWQKLQKIVIITSTSGLRSRIQKPVATLRKSSAIQNVFTVKISIEYFI
jgi:hypothetical protein